MSRNFYVRTCVKFTFANKIDAMYERSHVSVKVEPRSTSRLISTLYILPLFYLRDQNLRALTCVAKNASVEINLYPRLEWDCIQVDCFEQNPQFRLLECGKLTCFPGFASREALNLYTNMLF